MKDRIWIWTKKTRRRKKRKFILFFFFKSAQLSVEQPNGSRLTAIILVTCGLILFILGSFALFCFIRKNERIQEKFAEITRINSQSTNDPSRQRMQTDGKAAPVQQKPTGRARVKHDSEGSSSGNSTSSWVEEPIIPVNMDIMTGHLILVCVCTFRKV